MKSNKLRVIIPLAVLVVAGVGFALHSGLGTLSAVGWESISVLCPLGALGTMLASKTIVPRAVISLVLAVVAIVILGRAFCGWICPVPVWSKLRGIAKKQEPENKGAGKAAEGGESGASVPDTLSPEELKLLKHGCKGCGAHAPSNSRHVVLGGALLSAAIFGFPVFCLICPIGLSFALVFVLILLFGGGDVTWSVVLIPALLLVEVVFFRKWCSHICPLSALMSLVGKANRTLRPVIDDTKCLEVAHGKTCGRCSQVCEVAIDPRHPELGVDMSECIRCRKCIDACPGSAISMPFIAPKPGANAKPAANEAAEPSGDDAARG